MKIKTNMMFYLRMIVIGLVLSPVSFGFIAKPTNPKLVYCPQKLHCKFDDIELICKMEGGDPAYWSSIHIANFYSENHDNFTATLKEVAADYNKEEFLLTADCYYKYQVNNEVKNIVSIYSATGSNLLAYVNKENRWDTSTGYKAYCRSSNTKDCPLFEKPEVAFDQCYEDENISICSLLTYTISANHIVIKKDTITSVNYDEAIAACGSVKQCTLDVMWGYENNKVPIVKGKVVVDLSNNMKILSLVQDSSTTHFAEMKIQAPFNTVEIIQKEEF